MNEGSNNPKASAAGSLARVVFRETISHPLTLYPTACGFLGGLTWLLLEPTMLFASLGVGGLALGAGSWCFNYFVRGKSFESEYLRKLSEQLKGQSERLLGTLQKKLQQHASIPGAEKYAEQGVRQIEIVREQFENFEALLAEKLDPGELTFGRYRVTAEQVYLSVLDNLERISTTLASIKAIDPDYLNQHIAQLRRQKTLPPADQDELKAMEERSALRRSQLEKANQLLTYNEQAMTKLDNACTAVADMKTQRGRASLDLQFAMKELEELSKRASRYSSV